MTVIIPAYNEIGTIEAIIQRVRALEIDKEIIVVDNCSTDGTREILEKMPEEDGMAVVLQPENYGKGTSVRAGIERARGEFVVCQDADLEYDPQDIPRLLEVAKKGADAVFGTRLSDRARREGGNTLFSAGRRWVTTWFNLVFGARLTDVSTCYKMMRTEVIRDIPLVGGGFDLDFEIPAKLRKAGVEIVEVPVSYDPRDFEAGKKINWRDGLKAMWTILKFRFGG
ncbi:MAG: glycosyltransferase [Armatimonadia bacterium]|nr:glycosyltransferase [Armatimonadia bacterium]